MKLPGIQTGGVQSLGNPEKLIGKVGAVASAKTAETNAMVGALTGALDMAVESIDKFEKSKADMHMIEAMGDLEEKYAGVDRVPSNDPDIQKYQFDRNDMYGRPLAEIPVHEFYGQMYEETARRSMSEASKFIGLPGSRRNWSSEMGERHEKSITRMKVRMANQRQDYMVREQKLMIDAAMRNDRIGMAQQILQNFVGSPGERAVLESRIGKAGARSVRRRLRESGSDEELGDSIGVKDDELTDEQNAEEDAASKGELENRGALTIDERLTNGESIEDIEAEMKALSPDQVELVGGGVYKAKDESSGVLLDGLAVNTKHAEELEEKFADIETDYPGASEEDVEYLKLAAATSGLGDKELRTAISKGGSTKVSDWYPHLQKNDRKSLRASLDRAKKNYNPGWKIKQEGMKKRVKYYKDAAKLDEAETGSAVSVKSGRRYAEVNNWAHGTPEEKEKFVALDVDNMQDELNSMQRMHTKRRQERLRVDMAGMDTEGELTKIATEGVSPEKAEEIQREASYAVNNAQAETDKPLGFEKTAEAVNRGAKMAFAPKERTGFADIPKFAIDMITKEYKRKHGKEPTAQTVEKWYEHNRKAFK